MYRVIELQTNGTATSMIDHDDFPDKNHADSVAHGVAQYAAISNVEVHTVEVLNSEGVPVTKFIYKHAQQQTGNSQTPIAPTAQNGGEE